MQIWLVTVLLLMMVLSGCWLLVHAQPQSSPPSPQPIVSPLPAPGVPDRPKPKARRSAAQAFSGTITAINIPAQQLVVKNSQGTVQSFFLDPRTKLSKGRPKTTLTEFSS
ncbi:MAG: hypothetical protein HYZ73_05840 [Elusimicrobia bacterium]|nr:hypothetical protein [Elusimicrobiota bacterium]